MPWYRINPGYSFRDSCNTVRGGDELIELAEDFAQQHREKVTQVEEPAGAAELSDTPDSAAQA